MGEAPEGFADIAVDPAPTESPSYERGLSTRGCFGRFPGTANSTKSNNYHVFRARRHVKKRAGMG
jgi:hypothetical protein